MPLIETRCKNPECYRSEVATERFLWHAEDPNPDCETCGSPTERLISRFAAIWTGTLSRFDDASKERYNSVEDGHIAYRVRSSRMADGSPEKVYLRTRQDQMAYCRDEGVMDPLEVNPNLYASKDGSVPSTQGLPGSWT